MILCKITGSVVASHKNEHLENYKLLVAQPVDLDGNHIGNSMVAVDRVDAGEDDLVLVVKEGGSARIAFGNNQIPLQAFIVAVVDSVDIDPQTLQQDWPATSK